MGTVGSKKMKEHTYSLAGFEERPGLVELVQGYVFYIITYKQISQRLQVHNV